jgi:hypothetical protein
MGAVIALGTKIGNRLLQGESELHDNGVRDGRVEADVTVCIPVRGEDEPFRAKLHESFALDAAGQVDEIWTEGVAGRLDHGNPPAVGSSWPPATSTSTVRDSNAGASRTRRRPKKRVQPTSGFGPGRGRSPRMMEASPAGA